MALTDRRGLGGLLGESAALPWPGVEGLEVAGMRGMFLIPQVAPAVGLTVTAALTRLKLSVVAGTVPWPL